MAETIEVFQDMALHGLKEQRPALRSELTSAATFPWYFDRDRSLEVAKYAASSEDVLIFCRQHQENEYFPTANLTLWETKDGYYVSNIVPVRSGSLNFRQYNLILMDFVQKIAQPIAEKFGFSVELSKSCQSLEDWLTPDAQQKLRSFSMAANKSTGASHPSDQRRWFDFIIAVHKSSSAFSPEILIRWLHEVDEWDQDIAHDLGIYYERSLSLLNRYDSIESD